MKRMKPIVILISFAFVALLIGLVIWVNASQPIVPCTSYSTENCPEQCVVCPACAVCSAISCQSEEFCQSIGFDREWYKSITERLNSQ